MNERKIYNPYPILFYVILIILSSCNKINKTPTKINESDNQGHRPFDSDREQNSLTYDQLSKRFGLLKKPSKSYHLGAVMKFMGNQYWQLLADGMSKKSTSLDTTIDIQSGPNESDPLSQLKVMNAMVARNYDAILISPQTNTNLDPAIVEAEKKGILIVVVDDAVPSRTKHFVGPNQYQNGVHAANFFIEKFPLGGEVALIRGVRGSYAVERRSQGFIDTLKGSKYKIVADETGQWDLQKAIEVTNVLLAKHPKLSGFYCNNDIMALGVVESVKINHASNTIVVGTDGIGPAKDSIMAGELSATIDSFPFITGEIAVEVALRLLEGQKIPKAIFTPQVLVTKKSLSTEFKK